MEVRRGYRQLRAWQLGMELAEAAYRIARRLPPEERLGLASQMKRAATSVPLNLAEGYGRGGREFVRFIGIAYGSLLEFETQVELGRRLNFVSPEDVDDLERRTAELGKVLNGLRRSLRAAQERKTDPRVRDAEGEYLRRCALHPEN